MVSQTDTRVVRPNSCKEPNLSWKRAKGPNENVVASKCYLGPNFWNLTPKGPTWRPCILPSVQDNRTLSQIWAMFPAFSSRKVTLDQMYKIVILFIVYQSTPTGRAIATNHAERAFPSCWETARCWRISYSLWRDVSEWCSLAKTQSWLFVLKMCSASNRKKNNSGCYLIKTSKYKTELARRKQSKVAKNELRNRNNFLSFIFAQTMLI